MVNLSLCLTKHHTRRRTSCLLKHYAMKTYWGSRGIVQSLLNSALAGGEWSALPRGKSTRYTLGPIACLGAVGREKIPAPAGNGTPFV